MGWQRSKGGAQLPAGLVLTGVLSVAALMVMVASVQSFVGIRTELLVKPVQQHTLQAHAAQGRPAHKKSLAERRAAAQALKEWEDRFFHPLPKGTKLTKALRTKIMSTRQARIRSVLGKKAQAYEDATFQPLGNGAKLSDQERFSLFKAGQERQLTGKASKWQNWEDNMFGHSMKAVASKRLPVEVASKKHAKKSKKETYLDKLVSQSWTSKAETGGDIEPKKVQRFIDSLDR